MLEITTTRHNPLIDPHLAVWSWEIPVYLFLGGLVAGMMILGRRRDAAGRPRRRPKHFFSLHAPLLGVRADQPRHGRAVPRSHSQALRLARLSHVPAELADVVGLVGADHRLRRAARVGDWSGCPKHGRGSGERLAARLPRVGRAASASSARSRRSPGRTFVLGVGAWHLHRDPARHDGRAAAVEQRDPRAAVPVLRVVGRRCDASSCERRTRQAPSPRRG